jgi:carbamoyl-phosphate synthase small subunit
MSIKNIEPALLLLADGTVFNGMGNGIENGGELCFNTGMTGYQETFTDPSYAGQLLICTHVHIGNYGCVPTETESHKPWINGLICRSLQSFHSRLNPESESLYNWLSKHQVPFIEGIDTRALVRHLRRTGAQNALIAKASTPETVLKQMLHNLPSMQGQALGPKVSCTTPRDLGNPNAKFRVACVDFGIKESMITCLVERGVFCRVFPMNSSFREIMNWNPDGFLLSNGPGDPAAMPEAIALVSEILSTKKPVFGICMGHQLLSLALNLKTFKMHHGHRGLNHPVLNLQSGKGEITSQNHGFAVSLESLSENPDLILTHKHLNDGTVAGIRHKSLPFFSVQYHPEASAGPHDSRYLFDDFIELLETHHSAELV